MKKTTLLIFLLALPLSIYLIELGLYAFAPTGISFMGLYPFFNVERIDHFIDLQVLTLNGIDCVYPIESIYEKSCYFNPTNIPKLFIHFARLLHIGSSSTNVAGFLLGTTSICLLLFVYRYCLSFALGLAGASVVIGTFPFRLALERGNIDLLILDIMIVSALFLALIDKRSANLEKKLLILASTLMVGVAFLGKIYPVVSLLAIYLYIYSSSYFPIKVKNYIVVISVAIFSVLGLSLLPDLQHMTSSSYREISGGLGYGLVTSPDPSLDTNVIILSKLTIILSSAILFYSEPSDFFGTRLSGESLQYLMRSPTIKSRLIATMYLYGLSIFVGTYFVFVNGVYRLSVPLVLMSPWIIHTLISNYSRVKQEAHGALFILITTILVSYSGYRPYPINSNLQHLTQMLLEFGLYPLIIGFILSIVPVFLSSSPNSRNSLID